VKKQGKHPVCLYSHNQKEIQTTLSFFMEFTNEQGAQKIEAHKISAQTDVQCSLKKFWKIHEEAKRSLEEYFIYLPDFF
jgi:hypothetical protein